MNALPIARLQFATTTSFHFLFVLLTLGLVTLVAVMQTRWTVGGKPELESAWDTESMNDLGGHGAAGDLVVGWHFENPAPASLIFFGPANDFGSSC